jgi:hypothetical protein
MNWLMVLNVREHTPKDLISFRSEIEWANLTTGIIITQGIHIKGVKGNEETKSISMTAFAFRYPFVTLSQLN